MHVKEQNNRKVRQVNWNTINRRLKRRVSVRFHGNSIKMVYFHFNAIAKNKYILHCVYSCYYFACSERQLVMKQKHFISRFIWNVHRGNIIQYVHCALCIVFSKTYISFMSTCCFHFFSCHCSTVKTYTRVSPHLIGAIAWAITHLEVTWKGKNDIMSWEKLAFGCCISIISFFNPLLKRFNLL